MSVAVLDACCLIDLLASGKTADVLAGTGQKWLLPTAVQAEIRYVRAVDPQNAEQTINLPVDLQPLFDAKLLESCDVNGQAELERFVSYATRFRSDGDAMCLAIAESRNCTVATDDRKMIRIASDAGIPVVSCPEIMKQWAEVSRASASDINAALHGIERLAQFRPSQSMPCAAWWAQQIAR